MFRLVDRLKFGKAGLRHLLDLPAQLGIGCLSRKLKELVGLLAETIFEVHLGHGMAIRSGAQHSDAGLQLSPDCFRKPPFPEAMIRALMRNKAFIRSQLYTPLRTQAEDCLTSEKCHVWTAPSWQGESSRSQGLVGAAMCSAC